MDNKSHLDTLLESFKDLENAIKEILKSYWESCFIEINGKNKNDEKNK